MKTEWNLKLLYQSPQDPQIEKDIQIYEKTCAAFERKYRKATDYLENEEALGKALKDYEIFYKMVESSRPQSYFYFRIALNSADTASQAELNKITDRYIKAQNKTLFFELSLGKISPDLQKVFLKSDKLKDLRYVLERIFLTAKYNLSEAEEKIISLLSLPSYSMWVSGQNKVLNQQTVLFQNKEMPIAAALATLSVLPTKERRILNKEINKVLKSISSFAESELNAVITNKKISDELRGFKHPYSATIFGYQNDEKSIVSMTKTVTDNFKISHSFYELKSKLLKLKTLEYADRSAQAGKISRTFPFNESARILSSAFSKADPEFNIILQSYLQNGQIDVFPKVGKSGGAYCAGQFGLPTFVLLNHTDSLSSLKTFAHEMGHAIHTDFIHESQRPFYVNYPISIAEVASTLFENFVFDEVFETLSKKEQIIALHDRLNDFISTIFRQIACFNYELELHTTVREKGGISKEDIATLHNKHMQAYLGPLFKLVPDDGYFFVPWSHLRRSFYVYSYAYGALISSALYRRYKKDKGYIEKIKEFLKAGASASPENIFKNIGIDTSKPAFFQEGLTLIAEDIEKLKKLITD